MKKNSSSLNNKGGEKRVAGMLGKRSSLMTIGLFAVAAVLLLVSTIGGARAALTYFETYQTQITMQEIGVGLLENGTAVEGDGALMQGQTEGFVVGKSYKEELTAANTGVIDEYVRMIVYRYWVNGQGKAVDLDPSYIELTFGDGWVVDTAASTPERTVLYYASPIASGEVTTPAVTAVKISNDIAAAVTKETTVEGNLTTITMKYEYNGLQFGLEAEVDGVQTHNAEDAILSAWGRSVSVSGGTLTLN